jgi:hypothetical protein
VPVSIDKPLHLKGFEMRMELMNTFDVPASVVVRFNGEEVKRAEFAAGEKIKLEYNPPADVSGEVRCYLLQSGEERALPGLGRFTRDDVKGAQMHIEDADLLQTRGNSVGAREKLVTAIEILERLTTDSADLAAAKEKLALLDAASIA